MLSKSYLIRAFNHTKSALSVRDYKTKAKKIPDFTQERYQVERKSFGAVSDADLSRFEKIIGSKHVITDSDELLQHNVDFLKAVRGNSKIVLKPENTDELSQILKYCCEKNLAVCPQGGNTGLVGGSVPVFDEIVVSLNRMNKIHSIDEISGIATVDSGVILENLEKRANEYGLVVPLDLGAKASCHIGGNVSTNAGGLRVIRYGNLHGSVLGVESVLANGTILDLMSNFKKDNTGYHLKHLFIGSEGTLGIISKLAILCPHAPRSFHVAFIGLPSFDAVLKTYLDSKRQLAEILSSCEMMDADALNAAIQHFGMQRPIDKFPFYMLLETSGSNAEHDLEKFNNFLENGMESGNILDGTVTGDPGKIKELWKFRELIPVALIEDGYCFKYDISLPLKQFYDIVPVMRERCGSLSSRVCGYGHLGDSNLHLNISCKEFTPEIYSRVEPYVFEYTSQLKGSVSAEHGIGFLKTKYLSYTKSENAINMMREIKKLMDPKGILNPYKVLPSE